MTQIIHFVGGVKRTIPNIIKVYENEMLHILTAEGIEWVINKNNILATEILPPKPNATLSNLEGRDGDSAKDLDFALRKIVPMLHPDDYQTIKATLEALNGASE